MRKKKIRFSLSMFPSLGMVFFAVVFWLCGTYMLPLMPWFCLISALVVARHIVFKAKFPSFFTWFAATYIGLFLVYPWAAPLFGIDMGVPAQVFINYCLLAVGGIHLFIIGYELASPSYGRRRRDACYRTTSNRLLTSILLLLALNLLAVFLLIVNAGSFSTLLSQTRLEMKLHVGILSTLAVYLLDVGSLLYPLIAVHVRHKPFRALAWLPIIGALEVFLFLAFRVRTFPVIHVVGLLVGWFMIAPRMVISPSRSGRHLRTGLTLTQKITLVGLVATLIMGMFVLRTFRGQFQEAESFADINIDLIGSVQLAFEGGGELGYSKWVFRILEIVPDQHGYLYGQSYYRILFVLIPRALWPDKPPNSQRIMAQWLTPGTVSVQTTPVGIIGDLYVNFGMWGILGMLAFGCAFGRLDRSSEFSRALFLAVSFAMIFHLVRGGFTNPLVNLAVYYVAAKLTANHMCRGLPPAVTCDPNATRTNKNAECGVSCNLPEAASGIDPLSGGTP